jgi:transcriptional regulator with XRE-family HTH domain
MSVTAKKLRLSGGEAMIESKADSPPKRPVGNGRTSKKAIHTHATSAGKTKIEPKPFGRSGPQRGTSPLTSAPAVQHRTFGEKLRQHREASNLTLTDLAARAGISVGILSQVERGINSPSLRTLGKVRNALGLPSSFFFDDDHLPKESAGEPDFICRVADRPQLDLGPGAPHKELLHHGGSRVFEFMTIDMPPHSQSGTSSYPSEKGGYLLAGQVVLTVGDVSSTLHSGDSFLFDGVIPHDVRNPYDHSAKLLWIIAKLPNSLLI